MRPIKSNLNSVNWNCRIARKLILVVLPHGQFKCIFLPLYLGMKFTKVEKFSQCHNMTIIHYMPTDLYTNLD